jgi:hypothetical protein
MKQEQLKELLYQTLETEKGGVQVYRTDGPPRSASGGRPARGRRVHSPRRDERPPQQDEHLYHTTGWTRELWIQALGMKAVLPPPEEEKDVKTAIGAARAKHARREML